MLVERVKEALRIKHFSLDREITDIVKAALRELKRIGVDVPDFESEDIDPLIIRAVIIYAKAEFGLENKDSEKYYVSFNRIANSLALTGDYHV